MAKANLLGKRKPEDGLETKPILKKPKEKPEEKEIDGRVELSETKSDQANFISVKETVVGLDKTRNFEEPALPKKKRRSLCSISLPKLKYQICKSISNETQLENLHWSIDFFKDVGQVVRVRLRVTRKCIHRCVGFVEFASAKEAKMALEKKNGEYLLDRQISLANKGATPSMFCMEHTVWYEDYPQQVSLLIEEDETPPDFAEAVLFVANLSPQTTKIAHIIKFFKGVANVVSVRLIVNHEGKHVGYGFVEFDSAYEAKWALEKKNGEYLHDHKILLMKGQDKSPDSVEAVAVIEKTLYVANLSYETEISDIINFFKDVGEVVHVRLMVDYNGKHVGDGFVEFASSSEAEKALEKKNGEYLHDCQIFVDVVETDPYPRYPPRPMYCIDHKVWYEEYLGRESLLIEEDAAEEEVLDETPDFAEDVAVREKTVFVASISKRKGALFYISNIIKIFKDVGEIVRVRLIVTCKGRRVGCGFVEFASADEAKKAVQEKDGRWIYVNMAEIAPYPFRPKYNLYKLAKKLWYEDNLRREGLGLMNKPNLEKQKVFCGKKITFSDDD